MADPMTDEQVAVRLAGVRAERVVYAERGWEERVAACDAAIERLMGSRSPASQARAERRPRPAPSRETR